MNAQPLPRDLLVGLWNAMAKIDPARDMINDSNDTALDPLLVQIQAEIAACMEIVAARMGLLPDDGDLHTPPQERFRKVEDWLRATEPEAEA